MYKIWCHGSLDSDNFFNTLEEAKAEVEKRCKDWHPEAKFYWKQVKNKYRYYGVEPGYRGQPFTFCAQTITDLERR